jgi:hypothetical protein
LAKLSIEDNFPTHAAPVEAGQVDSRIDKVAIGCDMFAMHTVSIKQAKDHLSASARRVETQRQGDLRNGAASPQSRARLRGSRRFQGKRGIGEVFTHVAEDFDAPLPEDFLLRPLD